MALLSMLMLLLLPCLTSPALAMTNSGDEEFMVLATTLSEEDYEVTYMMETEVSSQHSKRSSFTEEFLHARFLARSDDLERTTSLPTTHDLISRFQTNRTLNILVQPRRIEASHLFKDMNEDQRLSFKTKDLLAKEKGKNPADYASFWLVRGDGIYCHPFDINGKPTRNGVMMHSFSESLTTDPESFADSETEACQKVIYMLMKKIVKQRQTKKAQVSVQTSFVTFGTILDKKHPVYYKIKPDEPTNKAAKRRSFTMDLLKVYLLEETGTEFSHDVLPITYPFLKGQVLTTMTIYLYVTNIEEPKTSTANERKEIPKRSPTKLSLSNSPLYFPEDWKHRPVSEFHLNIPEEILPKQLEPVLDTLNSDQDLQGHTSMHMYSFDFYFSPIDGADNEFWLIDGKGIHRYRFNAHGALVGKGNTMALWESTTLPVNPGSPQNNKQIQRSIGRLMKTLKEERVAD